jgi:hypothetical protein
MYPLSPEFGISLDPGTSFPGPMTLATEWKPISGASELHISRDYDFHAGKDSGWCLPLCDETKCYVR